ncbi:MAG TPA: hypothetical protein VMT18_12015 [Planctomycetota bacterium]|nr:hypothetical protein [Planctomycetota bacterium]
MQSIHVFAAVLTLALTVACGGSEPTTPAEPHADDHAHESGAEPHAHEGAADPVGDAGDDHAHDELPLGTAPVGELTVTFAQGHGTLAAGKEAHLVVKLPYNDGGETIVRGWIGTEDRTLSLVGKAEYAASHDDYDLHAMAPSPLPEGVRWWVELERPDGTRLAGSVAPLME